MFRHKSVLVGVGEPTNKEYNETFRASVIFFKLQVVNMVFEAFLASKYTQTDVNLVLTHY